MAGAYKLVVGCLPHDISEDELRTVFSTYGEVLAVDVLPDGRRAGSARQAHVTYRESKGAEDAVAVLHDVYKIRAGAERPIRVGWHAEDVAGGGGDWSEAGKQDSSAWDSAHASGTTSAGGQQSKPPEDGHKLFIGGLPEDISEDELRSVFGTYGEVVHVHVMKANSMTGLRGAFVFYSKREAGEDAIKVLDNNYKIRTDAEAPIQVRWGKEGKGEGKGQAEEMPNKLFVGSLPPDVTEEELKSVFGTYGEVSGTRLLAPHAKTGMRAALVFYARRESGEDAIKVLHEIYKFREDAELPIQVKWGKDREAPWAGGKDKGKGWGQGWAGDAWGGGWGKGGKDRMALGNGGAGAWQERGRGWEAAWWQDSRSGGRGDGWRDGGWGGKGWGGGDGWGGGGKGKGGDKGCHKGDKGGYEKGGKGGDKGGYGKGGKGYDKGGYDKGGYDKGGYDKGGYDKGYDKGGYDKGGYDKGGYDKGGYEKGGYDKGGYDKGGYDKGGYDKGGKGADKGKGKSADKGWGRGGGPDENQGKLHVANLPEDIQESALEYVFGTYGKVQKVYIMANNSRNGAVAAFVEFATVEEADTAIASLHEKYEIREGYGPITVRHANAKRPRAY